MTVGQCSDQIVLVDRATASDVDEHAAGRHGAEDLGVEQVTGAWRFGNCSDYDGLDQIGGSEHLVHVGIECPGLRALPDCPHAHAEDPGQDCHAAADRPQSDDCDGVPGEL